MSGRGARLRRLESLGRRRGEVELAIAEAVARARAAGATWRAVGAALEVSAQAAQQRYGRDHQAVASPAGPQPPLTTPAGRTASPGRRGTTTRKEKRA